MRSRAYVVAGLRELAGSAPEVLRAARERGEAGARGEIARGVGGVTRSEVSEHCRGGMRRTRGGIPHTSEEGAGAPREFI
jgi:hypothetical protein